MTTTRWRSEVAPMVADGRPESFDIAADFLEENRGLWETEAASGLRWVDWTYRQGGWQRRRLAHAVNRVGSGTRCGIVIPANAKDEPEPDGLYGTCWNCWNATRVDRENKTGFISHAADPYWTTPPCEMLTIARLLRMFDERTHGWEPREDDDRVPFGCTFTLLLDRPGEIEQVTNIDEDGRQDTRYVKRPPIPSHLTEFVAWLRHVGSPWAEKVAELKVVNSPIGQMFETKPYEPEGVVAVYPNRPDACRELLRRLKEMMTERCPNCKGPNMLAYGPLTCGCFGLGWKVKTK